jgi:hypothetical protein
MGDTIRADVLGVDLGIELIDLNNYRRSALQNFGNLRNGLRSLQSELSETKANLK